MTSSDQPKIIDVSNLGKDPKAWAEAMVDNLGDSVSSKENLVSWLVSFKNACKVSAESPVSPFEKYLNSLKSPNWMSKEEYFNRPEYAIQCNQLSEVEVNRIVERTNEYFDFLDAYRSGSGYVQERDFESKKRNDPEFVEWLEVVKPSVTPKVQTNLQLNGRSIGQLDKSSADTLLKFADTSIGSQSSSLDMAVFTRVDDNRVKEKVEVKVQFTFVFDRDLGEKDSN